MLSTDQTGWSFYSGDVFDDGFKFFSSAGAKITLVFALRCVTVGRDDDGRGCKCFELEGSLVSAVPVMPDSLLYRRK